ncbi:hypothetical protein FF011L_38680 [Roseimaritima multifibrata]|uniref:Uncharacterized protein n=1 Tax=Roseimaritima multifibrata TaxID=1930274 RepID=A0A517MJP9_9BACT|nr:hypothetical protein FF011L_38680 [Roseimaritima multifibrata]
MLFCVGPPGLSAGNVFSSGGFTTGRDCVDPLGLETMGAFWHWRNNRGAPTPRQVHPNHATSKKDMSDWDFGSLSSPVCFRRDDSGKGTLSAIFGLGSLTQLIEAKHGGSRPNRFEGAFNTYTCYVPCSFDSQTRLDWSVRGDSCLARFWSGTMERGTIGVAKSMFAPCPTLQNQSIHTERRSLVFRNWESPVAAGGLLPLRLEILCLIQRTTHLCRNACSRTFGTIILSQSILRLPLQGQVGSS